MKFIDLFNRMHCDFFEIQKNGNSEIVEYEKSGKMLNTCRKYFDDEVIDFYVTKSKDKTHIGLIIRLM